MKPGHTLFVTASFGHRSQTTTSTSAGQDPNHQNLSVVRAFFFFPLRYAANIFYCLEKPMMRITNGWKNHRSNGIKWNHAGLQFVKGLAQVLSSFSLNGNVYREAVKNNSSFPINLLLLADHYQTCASHVSAQRGRVVTSDWYDLGPSMCWWYHYLVVALIGSMCLRECSKLQKKTAHCLHGEEPHVFD